jgi:colanic acid biosynthesis glycosyl transferase WcaI
MHILYLTHYFPPEVNAPANRVYELAKEWVRLGHQVTVVTCAPNHPDGVLQAGYRNKVRQREIMQGIEVVRIWTYIAANEGFVLRVANYLSYLIVATALAPGLPRPDVVVSTSPQFFCGLAGYPVSRLKRIPWVLEIRDLWPESVVAVGAMRPGRMVRMLEAVEAWAYRTADRIVSVSEAFVPHLTSRGANPSHIAVVENGVDLDLFAAPADASAFRAEHQLDGKFVAAYIGTHGMAHHLETVLEAATLTRDDASIAYLLVGSGAERDRLLAERDARGLSNVIMLPQRPRSDMPLVWAATDVSLVLLKNSPVFRTVIPSKIFEAMAMARPIVLAVDGIARRIVEEANCGITIEPENAAQLAAAVRRLAANHVEREALGRSGRAYVQGRYTRRALAQRYVQFLQGAAAANGRAVAPRRAPQ